MGALARTGIAEPIREMRQKELEKSMQNAKNNPALVESEKLSSSSIASRRGMTARRRRPGLINEESTETLGAKGL